MNKFDVLVRRRGGTALIHREADLIPCPCRTPEGFRDPKWHRDNPNYPECNAAGFIPTPTEYTVKAFVQPAASARARNVVTQLFGEVQVDDHLGLFPLGTNAGVELNFENWSPAGEEYVEYNGMRFIVVGYSLVPDPHDGTKNHHYELALRRINKDKYGPNVGF